jgi:RNA recognition motif-containing protein
MKDLKTGQSMGCGVIEFDTAANANAAVKVTRLKMYFFSLKFLFKGIR